jgi:hypothetical protein
VPQPEVTVPWLLSRRGAKSLSIAAWTTISSWILMVLGTLYLDSTLFRDTDRIPIGLLTFSLFMLLVALLMGIGVYLFLAMLFFMFRHDKRPRLFKYLLTPLFILGTTVTAVIYYFSVYRPSIRRLGS